MDNCSDPRALSRQTIQELAALRRPHDDVAQLSNVAKIQSLRRRLGPAEQKSRLDATRVQEILTNAFNKRHKIKFEETLSDQEITRFKALKKK